MSQNASVVKFSPASFPWWISCQFVNFSLPPFPYSSLSSPGLSPFSFLLSFFKYFLFFSTGFGQCDYAKGLPLASVSIATVQASTPQSGPRLRFGATPLVPCPFAFQPNPIVLDYVAEQTLTHSPPLHATHLTETVSGMCGLSFERTLSTTN